MFDKESRLVLLNDSLIGEFKLVDFFDIIFLVNSVCVDIYVSIVNSIIISEV